MYPASVPCKDSISPAVPNICLENLYRFQPTFTTNESSYALTGCTAMDMFG